MPKRKTADSSNFKSFLNRSLSKLELKNNVQESTTTTTSIVPTTTTIVEKVDNNQTLLLPSSPPGLKRESSNKSLYSSQNLSLKPNMNSNSSNTSTMRKSETVLGLSNNNHNHNSSSSSSHSHFPKSLKDKILSRSSHAINTLIHKTTVATSPSTSTGHGSGIGWIGSNIKLTTASTTSLNPPNPMLRLKQQSPKPKKDDEDIISYVDDVSDDVSEDDEDQEDEVVDGDTTGFISCKLCLCNIKLHKTISLEACDCRYCKNCLIDYLNFEIQDGCFKISCPDSACPKQGELTLNEVSKLVSEELMDKFRKFRLYREVEKDSALTWCPTPGCETICHIEQVGQEVEDDEADNDDQGPKQEEQSSEGPSANNKNNDDVMIAMPSSKSTSSSSVFSRKFKFLKRSKCPKSVASPQSSESASASPPPPNLQISCPTCSLTYCASCKLPYHYLHEPNCSTWRARLIKLGQLTSQQSSLDDEALIVKNGKKNQDALIKKCPNCSIYIEKDAGCAQMMCKRCKHVFCWFCLKALNDDFLLLHFDSGPCKNKLGHSRASVLWHRIQIVGIFTGFSILVLIASPILLLAAPCILCCHCRYCSIKDEDDEQHTAALANKRSSVTTTTNVNTTTNSNNMNNYLERINEIKKYQYD